VYDDGMTGQILLSIGSEVAVFAFELLDSVSVMDAFVVAQVVFVGKLASTRWTRVGTLLDGEVYG
jgi:hypothetical protein